MVGHFIGKVQRKWAKKTGQDLYITMYIYIYIYIYIHVYIICMYIPNSVRTHMSIYTFTYRHIYIYT